MFKFLNIFNRLDLMKQAIDSDIRLLEQMEHEKILQNSKKINKDLCSRIDRISKECDEKVKETKGINSILENKIRQIEAISSDKDKNITKCYKDIQELSEINKLSMETIEEMKGRLY
jgi:hypothetical protein